MKAVHCKVLCTIQLSKERKLWYLRCILYFYKVASCQIMPLMQKCKDFKCKMALSHSKTMCSQ